jgi:zinc D-Ala-D-Ala carboxypeptidase
MPQISPHFDLSEFVVSQTAARQGINNTPSPGIVAALTRTAALLEQVRSILGDKSIRISSGYRSAALNAAVGGAPNSRHVDGLAADFICPDFGDPLAICQKLAGQPGLAFDQLIHEFTSWVHIGLAPAGQPVRHQVLTIDSSGTRSGLV